jgi:hypothetical protein
MTSPYSALHASLYGTLTAGTPLTSLLSSGSAVYNMQAPDGAVLPYIVFSHAGGGQEAITPSNMQNVVYYIRAYATNATLAGSIDAQIDALIHKKTLTVTGWTNFYTSREDNIPTVETTPSGEVIYSAGAYYRIRLDE